MFVDHNPALTDDDAFIVLFAHGRCFWWYTTPIVLRGIGLKKSQYMPEKGATRPLKFFTHVACETRAVIHRGRGLSGHMTQFVCSHTCSSTRTWHGIHNMKTTAPDY